MRRRYVDDLRDVDRLDSSTAETLPRISISFHRLMRSRAGFLHTELWANGGQLGANAAKLLALREGSRRRQPGIIALGTNGVGFVQLPKLDVAGSSPVARSVSS